MGIYALCMVAETIQLILALLGLTFCAYIVFKYLIQMDCKLYICLHYIFAIPLLVADVIISIVMFISLENGENSPIHLDRPLQTNFINVMEALRMILYVGLVF